MKTLKDFAKSNNLKVVTRKSNSEKIIAELRKKDSIIEYKINSGHGILCSCVGFGNSKKNAINELTKKISGKVLIVDAYGDRQEINIPALNNEIYMNVYREDGVPEEMAFCCDADDVNWWIRRKNNLSQKASLQFARKRITVHDNEDDAKKEYWDTLEDFEDLKVKQDYK